MRTAPIALSKLSAGEMPVVRLLFPALFGREPLSCQHDLVTQRTRNWLAATGWFTSPDGHQAAKMKKKKKKKIRWPSFSLDQGLRPWYRKQSHNSLFQYPQRIWCSEWWEMSQQHWLPQCTYALLSAPLETPTHFNNNNNNDNNNNKQQQQQQGRLMKKPVLFIPSLGRVRRPCRGLEKFFPPVLQRCYGCSFHAQEIVHTGHGMLGYYCFWFFFLWRERCLPKVSWKSNPAAPGLANQVWPFKSALQTNVKCKSQQQKSLKEIEETPDHLYAVPLPVLGVQ